MENWKGIFLPGILAGVSWGLAAMVVNSFTGVFIFEGGLLHTVISFALGGCLFGVVAGGFLGLFGENIPVKSTFAKATLVSLSIWLLLRGAGVVLTLLEPVRYHVSTPEGIQGFVLALLLGLMLGLFSRGGGLKALREE